MQPKRKFILGDEWLYIKVYSGPRLLEQVLVLKIQNQIRQIIHKEWISQFFFIRYADPDYHLRLRMRLTDIQYLVPIINELNLTFSDQINDRSIFKVSYDTYNREIERYGNAIELAEKIFCVDSISIMSYLFKANLSDEFRWLYSMVWIDKFLDSFQLLDEDKYKYYQKMCHSYRYEFGIQKPARLLMDKKYRSLYGKIEGIFYDTDYTSYFRVILQEVETFDKSSDSLVRELLEKLFEKKSNIRLESLISSIIHMHINRIFRTQQRKYELLIYHFLFKFQKSCIARKVHASKIMFQKSNE